MAGLLRTDGLDVGALTPGGEWTVRETAAHLIGGTRLYAALVDGRPSPLRSPADLAVFNAGLFGEITEDQPERLADLVESDVEALVAASLRGERDDPRPWHWGVTATVGLLVAFGCYEYLLHGDDIARAAGLPGRCSEPAARAVLVALAPTLPARVSRRRAGDLEATFALEIEAGSRVCLRVVAGSMELLSADTAADCSVSGSACRLLLWLSGRRAWENAGLGAAGPRAAAAPRLALALVNS